MNKKYRTIIFAGAALLLTATTAATATYALFSDQKNLVNHLEAGNLKLGLKRTYLEWKLLDEDGYLKSGYSAEVVDFTAASNKNLFGIDNAKIVPQSYVEATLSIENKGSVAFNYWINVFNTDEKTSSLLSQLEVTVSDVAGNVLNGGQTIANGINLGSETAPLGQIAKTDSAKVIKVKVEFKDLDNNNDAMDQVVNFDMTFHAVQAVNK